MRCGDELQPSTDGLRYARATGLLRFLKQFFRHLDCNLASFRHIKNDTIFDTSIEYGDLSLLLRWMRSFREMAPRDVLAPQSSRAADWIRTGRDAKRRAVLFRKHNSYRGAFFVFLRFDAHHVAAQAQRTVGRTVDAGIVEQDLQFGLQLGAMVQVDQRAV